MQLALSQICSLNSPLEKDFDEYAAGGCKAIEVWLTKLETWLETHSVDELRELTRKHELTLPVASYQGGLLTTQGEQRRQAWDLFRRRLELCSQLEIGTIVVACDVPQPISQQDVDRAAASLLEVAQAAGGQGLRAALEFQAASALGNNLQSAVALVADIGSPHLGLCLDAFHWYTGPSKTEDIELLTTENLFHVQLCDLADTPREFAVDAQRILPGEGDIPLAPLIQRLRTIGYSGHLSLELMNPVLWQVPALQFGEAGMQALRNAVGVAESEPIADTSD